MTQSACPACGVAVTSGYTRCPRCHAPMPSSRMRRESLLAGGTSVAPEPTGGRGLWIAIGAVVIAGGVAAVIALTRGGGTRAAVEADAAEEERAVAPAVVDVTPEVPVAPVRLDPLGALDRLERRLGAERMFARGTVRGEELELRSELCGEARLREILGEQAGDLRAQGLRRTRCIAPHGAEVFAQPL